MPIIEAGDKHVKSEKPTAIYVICGNCASIIELPIEEIIHEEEVIISKIGNSISSNFVHSLQFDDTFKYVCENCHSLELISLFYLEYKGIAYDKFGPVHSAPEELLSLLPNRLEILYMQQRRTLEYALENNHKIPDYLNRVSRQELESRKARQLEEFNRQFLRQMGTERYAVIKQRYEEEKANRELEATQLLTQAQENQKTKKRSFWKKD